MKLYPLRLVPQKTAIDFLGKRWWGFVVSITLTLLAMGTLFTQGLNLGIDFTGGLVMEIRTEAPADLAVLRGALDGKGLGEVSLQNFGDDHSVLLRVQVQEGVEQAALVEKVKAELAAAGQQVEYRKTEFVGPTVGQELIRGSLIAIGLSFAAIMVYMWFRFEWQYGVGGILALLHDATMMIGFYAITGFEFGLPAIAAVLTVVGYSINDSVVIYDRIRENIRKYKKMPMEELLNLSMNETLSRTIMTSITTLLAALALAIFGGEVIRGFSWSLVFGIMVGTYSSIYVSAPALIYLKLRKAESEATAPVAP